MTTAKSAETAPPLSCPVCGHELQYVGMRPNTVGRPRVFAEPNSLFLYRCLVHGPFHYSRKSLLTVENSQQVSASGRKDAK